MGERIRQTVVGPDGHFQAGAEFELWWTAA
jgi:hypothetical protein